MKPEPYENAPGLPVRRVVYREDGKAVAGDLYPKDEEWKPTWWGPTQMTHLPGVRDYLRGVAEKNDKSELQMNLLAEHGPQDLESAWMYFKHWVKKRPIGPESCILNTEEEPGSFSAFGTQQPQYMESATRPRSLPPPP